MEIGHRWDWAWKTFLDSKMPWCPWFLTQLISSELSDFQVDCAEIHEEPTEQVSDAGYTYMDKFFILSVDQKMKRVHLEFESKYNAHMGLRMLTYGLRSLRSDDVIVDAFHEHLYMPVPYIVQVRRWDTGNFFTKRVVHLHVGDQECEVAYPVVVGYAKVPFIADIMQASTIEQWYEATEGLRSQLPDFAGDAEVESRFIDACTLIASEKAYTAEGLKEGALLEMQKVYRGQYIPAEERGEQRGIEKGFEKAIQAIMKNLGLTREQAEKAVYGEEGKPGVSRMSLGD